ncbi:esterase-like activity of phytase family protein [Rhodobium gokarnense]|uniref:Phytase-like domain-containing protein n=1 Tax=Rhodobium gokarnense TaxID=364296 RepID=A0ABT3H9Q1_9HYPH|nr:esterase-like activity of phytase family protein [Rhodobium gokarnense]MCW2307127.1 hypothetical protein [Rhodobium gokarnense]
MRTALGALLLCCALAAPLAAAAAPRIPPGPESIEVRSAPIAHFRIGYPDLSRFGRLEYLGGFELWSPNRHFGALSGLVSLDKGRRIVAISDNGFWFDAKLDVEADGRPTAIHDARIAPMLDAAGEVIVGHDADAESVVLTRGPDPKQFIVSFEGDHRLERFPEDLDTFLGRGKRMKIPKAIGKLRGNRGLEAIAVPPETCPLKAEVIAIAERDPRSDRDIPAWIIGGPNAGRFRVRLEGDFSITDAAFLPDGDLLILERLFNFAEGVGMRVRRIPCAALKAGTTVDGIEMMTADFGYQIDNMEGLSVHVGDNGDTVLTLISDDNRSLLQRTLLLRFRLIEPPVPHEKGDFKLRPAVLPKPAAE